MKKVYVVLKSIILSNAVLMERDYETEEEALAYIEYELSFDNCFDFQYEIKVVYVNDDYFNEGRIPIK